MKRLLSLTENQRYDLEELWFEYGNDGPKHSHHNHLFIQHLLDVNEDNRDFLEPTQDCLRVVGLVLE